MYQFWPPMVTVAHSEVETLSEGFVAILCGDTNTLEWQRYNPEHMRFLEPSLDRDIFLDPWGRSYLIVLDKDRDNEVSVGRDVLHDVPVAVWSCGPNGVNDWGLGDDVASWNSGHR
jgi:hypothetical protein